MFTYKSIQYVILTGVIFKIKTGNSKNCCGWVTIIISCQTEHNFNYMDSITLQLLNQINVITNDSMTIKYMGQYGSPYWWGCSHNGYEPKW